ncbi:hypothetical protein GCM10027074_39540 [Streptomyces deserti]
MGALDLPDPVVRHGRRHPDGPPLGAAALADASRERVDGEVRFDAGSRAAYSTDASDFRQTPVGVVVPARTASPPAPGPRLRVGRHAPVRPTAAASGPVTEVTRAAYRAAGT